MLVSKSSTSEFINTFTSYRFFPCSRVSPPSRFISVKRFACTTTSTLWEWGQTKGSNSFLKAVFQKSAWSNEKIQQPRQIEGFVDVAIDLMTAAYDQFAFTMDGELFTCGSNDYGQLGRKTNSIKECLTPKSVSLPCNGKVVSVSLGLQHTAAVTEEGLLYTWGWAGSFLSGCGGLGIGHTSNITVPSKPVQQFIDIGEKVTQVACGSQHTIVTTESGKIFSTGKGEMGRLGLGGNQDKLKFEEIESFKNLPMKVEFSRIGCGASHSAVLLRSGELFVFGRNDAGQLGLENSMGDLFSHETFPVQLQSSLFDSDMIVDLSCCENATALICNSGKIYFFGARLWLVPHLVSIPKEVLEQIKDDKIIKVALGGGNFSFAYAMTKTGRLLSWGRTKSDYLARQTTSQGAKQPALVESSLFGDDQKVVDIACSRTRILALTQKNI